MSPHEKSREKISDVYDVASTIDNYETMDNYLLEISANAVVVFIIGVFKKTREALLLNFLYMLSNAFP